MAEPKGKAFQAVRDTAPRNTYRGAVVGCGRMGSTIDDEHIGMPHYPWPWAHAPAMIEARGIDLVAAADDDPAKLEDFKQRWNVSALYTDYREMVEKEQIDVVCLTTRPNPALKSRSAWPNWASKPSSPPNRCAAHWLKPMP